MLQIISFSLIGVLLFLTGIASMWIDVFQIVKFADKDVNVNTISFNSCVFPYKKKGER